MSLASDKCHPREINNNHCRWEDCMGLAGTLIGLGALLAMQLPFREYPAIEYNDFPSRPTSGRGPSGRSRD